MTKLPDALEGFDWSRTSWDGSRREQMRRWAALSLEQIIAAIEDMENLSRTWRADDALRGPTPTLGQEPAS